MGFTKMYRSFSRSGGIVVVMVNGVLFGDDQKLRARINTITSVGALGMRIMIQFQLHFNFGLEEWKKVKASGLANLDPFP
jgi:hypothetical protein